jgi:hypothetical protein
VRPGRYLTSPYCAKPIEALDLHIGCIEGATRVLRKAQGYFGLPVRDAVINCSVNGEGTLAMVGVKLEVNGFEFWFIMQIGMLCGS